MNERRRRQESGRVGFLKLEQRGREGDGSLQSLRRRACGQGQQTGTLFLVSEYQITFAPVHRLAPSTSFLFQLFASLFLSLASARFDLCSISPSPGSPLPSPYPLALFPACLFKIFRAKCSTDEGKRTNLIAPIEDLSDSSESSFASDFGIFLLPRRRDLVAHRGPTCHRKSWIEFDVDNSGRPSCFVCGETLIEMEARRCVNEAICFACCSTLTARKHV